MVFVKAADGLALVLLEAIRHQGSQRSGRRRLHAVGNIERRKPQIGHLADAAGAKEPARLQEAQGMAVACFTQESAIEIVRLPCNLVTCGFAVRMLADIGHERTRRLGPYAAAIMP